MYGWSQQDACRACGIRTTTWNNYEKGVSRPDLDKGATICEVFGVTLDWLYTGSTGGLSQKVLISLYAASE